MRESKITRTIEEVNGYIAEDGTWFKTKEDCQRYEESAKMVVYNMVKEKMIGKTTVYGLLNEGCEEDDVEIFRVDSMQTVELLNQYVVLWTYDKINIITTDMIGKDVIVVWSCDKDWCYCCGTIEDLLNTIKANYEKAIKKIE